MKKSPHGYFLCGEFFYRRFSEDGKQILFAWSGANDEYFPTLEAIADAKAKVDALKSELEGKLVTKEAYEATIYITVEDLKKKYNLKNI